MTAVDLSFYWWGALTLIIALVTAAAFLFGRCNAGGTN